MYDETAGPIHNLVHLFMDGAITRRGLVKRVAQQTGSVAAAVAALAGFEELQAQTAPPACPADIKVPADAPYLVAQDITFTGDDGTTLFGHLAYPKDLRDQAPGVIVIHENRGLVDHIKDVTRRVARAGYVAISVDLLSRQGGVQAFPEPTQQTAAYGRTNVFERRADLISTLGYLKSQPQVRHDRIGVVGFCAGGGNVWEMVINVPELAAAVPFYGAPAPSPAAVATIETPVLAIYAERDRALTQGILPVINEMIARQKTVGLMVVEGVGHAFHSDVGAAYNPEAACDAWARTIAWFDKWLRRP
ncbi:MAG: dienelactone hydrolase family protein [Bryobacterales bacterium]|nr:dienelactone hydrolase family protein [Bryobacterales bacterium]